MSPGIIRRIAALAFLVAVVVVYFRLSKSAFRSVTMEHAPAGYVVMNNVAVPMRDGVVLRADVWLPKAEGRFPTLVYRTPYGKENAPKEWITFEKLPAHGYAVVIQDVRGRYASGGEFLPYQNEGKDGYDTIEWAARQPWS